jgi:hypothetical protein
MSRNRSQGGGEERDQAKEKNKEVERRSEFGEWLIAMMKC